MKKPTAAQRKVLEAMRDGVRLTKNKWSGLYYLQSPDGGRPVAEATAAVLTRNGWIDPNAARTESENRFDMRLMPSGLAALNLKD